MSMRVRGSWFATWLLVAFLGGAFLAPAKATQPKEPAEAGNPVGTFADSFEAGLQHWEVLDPATWRAVDTRGATGDGDAAVEITARASDYRPPHRSPGHVAIARGVEGGSLVMTFRVKSLQDSGPHRDCCVFFGYQDAGHFYYAHLGAQPDPRSGQIMVVDGVDRVAISSNERPIPWTDGWHTVRLERDADSGAIRIYFDDAEEPILQATDNRFGVGRVGIGSFDDLCRFDDVRVEVSGQ